MLSDFSPILDHCSGRPERFPIQIEKSLTFELNVREIRMEKICLFHEFRLPIRTFCDILVI